MKHPYEKRFEDFFREENYVTLKNHLYNYLLRKRAVQSAVDRHSHDLILEVGSGLSPMMTNTDRIVFSELSFQALRTIKAYHGRGFYVVADGTRLPFAQGAFSNTVCSEVLEHLEDDQQAIAELARVMKPAGRLCITVPHRHFYFAFDDRFVQHFRRYELDEIKEKLSAAGLEVTSTRKVLGPLEKLTMFAAIPLFVRIQRWAEKRNGVANWVASVAPAFKWMNRAYAALAWLDAKIMPRFLSTTVLLEARKGRRSESSS